MHKVISFAENLEFFSMMILEDLLLTIHETYYVHLLVNPSVLILCCLKNVNFNSGWIFGVLKLLPTVTTNSAQLFDFQSLPSVTTIFHCKQLHPYENGRWKVKQDKQLRKEYNFLVSSQGKI